MKNLGMVSALVLILAACSDGADTNLAATDPAEESQVAGGHLQDVIDHPRRDEERARDQWRHPRRSG